MKKSILIALCLNFLSTSFAAVNFEELQEVKNAVIKAFENLKTDDSEFLTINEPIPGLADDYWWSIDMVHASYVRVPNEVENTLTHKLYLMGGFVRLDGMTPDGLAVTACHEMGHGIGGDPKKNPSMGMPGNTTEGQADYFATKICLPEVMKYLPVLRELTLDPYVIQLCTLQKKYDQNLCLRMMTALESDMAFFDYLGTPVAFDDFATEEALEINKDPSFYPSAQCRLDTMIHGILDLERPKCWYPSGVENGALRSKL